MEDEISFSNHCDKGLTNNTYYRRQISILSEKIKALNQEVARLTLEGKRKVTSNTIAKKYDRSLLFQSNFESKDITLLIKKLRLEIEPLLSEDNKEAIIKIESTFKALQRENTRLHKIFCYFNVDPQLLFKKRWQNFRKCFDFSGTTD